MYKFTSIGVNIMVKAVYDVILFSLNFPWRTIFPIYSNAGYFITKQVSIFLCQYDNFQTTNSVLQLFWLWTTYRNLCKWRNKYIPTSKTFYCNAVHYCFVMVYVTHSSTSYIVFLFSFNSHDKRLQMRHGSSAVNISWKVLD